MVDFSGVRGWLLVVVAVVVVVVMVMVMGISEYLGCVRRVVLLTCGVTAVLGAWCS